MSRNRWMFAAAALLAVVLVSWIGLSARASRRISAGAAAPAAAQNAHLEPVSATSHADSTGQAVRPDGSLAYTVTAAQPLAALVHKFWPQTEYMTKAELDAALRQANHLPKSGYLKAGQQVIIPGYQPQLSEKSVAVPPDFEVRAIYLTGTMAGSVSGLRIVQHWRQLGGNAIVFDVKDSDGSVNIPFEHPLAPHRSPAIPNLPKYVHWAHGLGLHVIARVALFRDENIAQHHSDLAVHSRRSGQPWLENGKLVWTDPSRPEVQSYDLALARTAAAAGVDEIQFDYVRFPAEGDQADAQFFYQSHPCGNADARLAQPASAGQPPRSGENAACAEKTRADVIASFLEKAYGELHPMHVLLSVDVFGVMAWQRPVDLNHTGQDIVRMVRWCDVLSPMIYPSHFFGMDGYADPGDAPEHFISESMARFSKITGNRVGPDVSTGQSPHPAESAAPLAPSGKPVVIRPWLQAFGWRTRTYSPEYIKIQVEAARHTGGVGFLFWNARNDYSKPMAAMPDMRKAGLFRGDEVPGQSPAKAAIAAAAAQPANPSGE